MTAIVSDVFMDRVLPLIIARASFSAMHPLEWGALELVVLGVLTQVGLEFYRHRGTACPSPSAAGWKHLPSRGKPLEVLAPRDRQFIAFSQVAIIVMTFHYLQFMRACWATFRVSGSVERSNFELNVGISISQLACVPNAQRHARRPVGRVCATIRAVRSSAIVVRGC